MKHCDVVVRPAGRFAFGVSGCWMRALRSTLHLRRSDTTRWLVGMLALVCVACGSSEDDDTSTRGGVTKATVTVPTQDPDVSDPASPEPTDPTSVGAPDDPVVDPVAVAEAEAVLIGIAERNEHLGSSYDIGGGDHCPLLLDFEGMWIAEAGGTLGCDTADSTMSIGATLSSTFADRLAEDDQFELVGDNGPFRSWCRDQACIVSWTSGTIDVIVLQLEAGDPSAAENFLRAHLVEIIDGVRTFDVDLIPAS